MNHIRTALFISASALAVMSMSAGAQMMRMQQQPPTRGYDPMVRDIALTQDQWINSLIDHWSGSQRRSWYSLDPTFRAWVSHLVWTRKNAGQPSVDSDVQRTFFQIPEDCPVASFVAPDPSIEESMSHLRTVMPEINWNAWNNIEPKFRSVAEWELSAGHARAQRYESRRTWWQLNDDRIRSCLEATAPSSIRTASASTIATPSRLSQANARYEQIARREKLGREAVDHTIAPEPIKREAREQISDAAIVDKYIADMDRSRP
jgi:hypothetical protein